MSRLVIAAFTEPERAAAVRAALAGLDADLQSDLADAVVIVRRPDGRYTLRQSIMGDSAGFWGFLIGTIFGLPFGFLGAAPAHGIDQQLIADVRQHLLPGGSVLFVLVRCSQGDRLRRELDATGAWLIETTLST